MEQLPIPENGFCKWRECDWRQWSQHILKEIERFGKAIDQINATVARQNTILEGRVSRLEIKAGAWGAIAGFLVALSAALIAFFKG